MSEMIRMCVVSRLVWQAALARRPVGLEIVGCDAAKLANLFRDLLASGGHNFRVLVFYAVARLGNDPKDEFVGRVRNWVFLDVSDHVSVSRLPTP